MKDMEKNYKQITILDLKKKMDDLVAAKDNLPYLQNNVLKKISKGQLQ